MTLRSLLGAALLALAPVAAHAQSVAVRIAPGNFAYVIPFEKSGSFNLLTQLAAPVAVGTPTWPNQASPPNCAISGAQSVGFAIDPTTCALTLKYDYKALNAGALGRWGKTRTFTVTANQQGGGTASGTVLVTFDTSLFQAQNIPVIGLDVLAGPDESTPYTAFNPAFVPSGWAYGTAATGIFAGKYLTPTRDNPAPLDHYLFQDTQIIQTSTTCFKGVKITRNRFVETAAFVPPPYKAGMVTNLCYSGSQDWVITDNKFELNGDDFPNQMAVFIGAAQTFSRNVGVGCNWDCVNLTKGSGGGNYLYNSRTNNRYGNGTAAPTSLIENQLYWDHADGYQNIDIVGPIDINNDYVDDRAYDWDYSQTTPRYPAGTFSCSSGSTSVTGVGTSWVSGNANDKLSTTEDIIGGNVNSIGFHLQIASVADDTHLTLRAPCDRNYSGVAYRAGLATAARTQTTSPFYQQGVNNPVVATTMGFPATFRNSIARGGNYGLYNGSTAAQFVAPFRASADIVWDWRYIPSGINLAQVRMDGIQTLANGALTPYPDQNPVLVVPVVATTQTTTSFGFTFNDQSLAGTTTVQQYRYKVGSNAWPAWTAAAPTGNSVTGLTPNTLHYLQVQAGNTPLADGADTMQTQTANVQVTTVAVAPTATATPGTGSVSVGWTENTPNGGAPLIQHRIYRGTSAGALSYIGATTGAPPYVDMGRTAGTTYYYAVTTVNAGGESAQSPVVSATP